MTSTTPVAKKVGIREFRENLATILESNRPVTITRHGETIGHFYPAPRRKKPFDRKKFRELAAKVDADMAAAGLTEEELFAEFEALRHGKK